jgi:L-lactate dehydrogenase (cytochrome)
MHSRDLNLIANLEDLRRLAKRRVPKMFYDYVDGGSWTEQTYRENAADFAEIHLRQRVAVDVSARSTTSAMVDQPVRMPVAIAPTGLTGMVHADGEILAARAAQKFGIPFTLSTVSICSLEDVADHVEQPFWFQLYVLRDRGFVDNLIDRAKAVGCSALVLTLDLQISSQRNKDIRNGLSSPPRPTLRNVADLATKPRWCLGMLGTRRYTFGNLRGHAAGLTGTMSLASWTNSQYDPSLTWDDVRHIRDRWPGKLIMKGITDAADAAQAVACGADAIVVSNHGGRQLDGAVSSISALPEIVAAVGAKTELHVDGGIRSGQDVYKAIALGAAGVYIGRAMLYGLGALGEAGVTRALTMIHDELNATMGLTGTNSIAEIARDNLIFGSARERLSATA